MEAKVSVYLHEFVQNITKNTNKSGKNFKLQPFEEANASKKRKRNHFVYVVL